MTTIQTISTTRSVATFVASSSSSTTRTTRTKTTTRMRTTRNTMHVMLNGRQRRRQRKRKDNRGANKTARSSSSSSSSSSPLSSSFDDDDDEISKNLTVTLDKLLVPFLALRRGSRFAHQEFVMAATEAYDEAISLGKLKTETYVLGLNSNISSESSKSSNNGSLGTSEQEAFLSHLSMVYCTLHYMGRASKKTDAFLVDPEKDKELKGIIGYIKMTHTNRDENGITLKRMEFEQRRVLNASEPNEDPRKYSKWDNSSGRNPNAKVNDVRQITPGILLMRTNARLSLLAKEMVEGPEGRKKDLPEVSEDEGEAVPTATTTTSRAIEPQLALEWSFRPRNDPELLLKRTLAARALTAFFSVLTAHPKGLKAFSLACVEAYEANISAEELVQSVSAAEFDCEATARGMFGKGADAPKLFAGFVSAAYLTAEYRLEQENKQQTTEKKKKTFAFANPPRWEEIDLSSSNGQDDIESRKKGNAYDYNFEFDEGRQIKYLEGFKTSIARWVSIGEKELFADVSTGLSVDEDNDEYDFDTAFKTAAAKQRQNMAGAPFADDDDSLSSSSTYQPSKDDEPVLDVNALYAKLLFEVSGYIGNQSDQPKVAALLQAYTQKILNAPIVQPPSLSQKSYDPESGEFLAVRAARDDDDQNDDDLSFKRNANNDFFAQSSITLASLNVQRAICSFVLREMSNKS